MTASLPTYSVQDIAGREVAEADGYNAARYAARFMLEEGEEAGPLRVFTAAGRELCTLRLEDGIVVGETRQGARSSAR